MRASILKAVTRKFFKSVREVFRVPLNHLFNMLQIVNSVSLDGLLAGFKI